MTDRQTDRHTNPQTSIQFTHTFSSHSEKRYPAISKQCSRRNKGHIRIGKPIIQNTYKPTNTFYLNFFSRMLIQMEHHLSKQTRQL
jgi:hypothetical protein